MARNQKLTSVIAGRSLTAVDVHGAVITVRFDDGSVMTVQTDGTPPAGAGAGVGAAGAGRRVRAVRQHGTQLILDLDDGGAVELRIAEATSSVMVRDKDQRFEYSD